MATPRIEILERKRAFFRLLTHLYDVIDLGRVIAAVEPAVALYRSYETWLSAHLAPVDRPSGSPPA